METAFISVVCSLSAFIKHALRAIEIDLQMIVFKKHYLQSFTGFRLTLKKYPDSLIIFYSNHLTIEIVIANSCSVLSPQG